MRRGVVFLTFLLLFVCFFALVVFGEEKSADTLPEEYGDFLDAIPEDVRELLPDGFFSGDADDVGDALVEISRGEYLLRYLFELISDGLGGALKSFASSLALVALCAVLGSVVSGSSGSTVRAVRYASSLALCVTTITMQMPKLLSAAEYFKRIGAIMNSLLPLMGVLYMAGGNAAAAATNNTTLVFWLNVLELAVSALVLPGVCACIALSLSDCLRCSDTGSLSGVCAVIKRSVGYVLGMCCTLLTAALSAQSILSAAADSAKARAVRYVAGNVIPVVGSTVGEALRTVATSVKILRSTVGVGGIIVILMILLPTLVDLLLCRLSLNTAAAIGEMVGVRESVRFFREVASIYGYLIAAVALASIMCCFALTVFALTSSQSGGL